MRVFPVEGPFLQENVKKMHQQACRATCHAVPMLHADDTPAARRVAELTLDTSRVRGPWVDWGDDGSVSW